MLVKINMRLEVIDGLKESKAQCVARIVHVQAVELSASPSADLGAGHSSEKHNDDE